MVLHRLQENNLPEIKIPGKNIRRAYGLLKEVSLGNDTAEIALSMEKNIFF